jgi:hypothetical protein
MTAVAQQPQLPINAALSSDSQVWARFEVITPAVAKRYLEVNLTNRNISDSVVNMYGDDMKCGRWLLTANGIGFDVEGVLVDGQHRLEAIVRSGVAEEFIVVYNLPKPSRAVTDIGRTRTTADELRMRGVTNNAVAAAAVKLYMEYERGTVGNTAAARISKPVLVDVAIKMDEDGKLSHAARQASKVHTQVRVSMSMLTMAYMLFASKDKKLADHYYEKLATGENVTGTILAVRNKLLKEQANKKNKLTTAHLLYALIRGWNALRKGELHLQVIKVPDAVTGKNMLQAI